MKQKKQFILFVVLFVLSSIRLTQFFRAPFFYAEDLTIFFTQSIELGTHSFTQPISQHFLIQRVIAYITTFFPTFYTPLIYQVSAGLISAWSFSLFAKSGYRWLIADDRIRCVLCVIFALLPGVSEIFFTLCTLYYPLSCAVFLLLLERNAEGNWEMSSPKSLFISFLWFSIGQGIIFLLPLFYLAVTTKNKTYLICIGSLLICAFLNAQASLLEQDALYHGHFTHLSDSFQSLMVYIDNLYIRLIFAPLVGSYLIQKFNAAPDWIFLILCTLISVPLTVLCRRNHVFKKQGFRFLAILVLCVFSVFPLTVWLRSYGIWLMRRPNIALGLRYSVLPAMIAVILWTAALTAKVTLAKFGRFGCAAILAVIFTNTLFEPLWQPVDQFPEFHETWPAKAAIIDNALRLRRRHELQQAITVQDLLCLPRGWQKMGTTLTIRPYRET
jgi:hypothetical protein